MVNTIFILDKTYNTTQILVGDKSSQRMFWDDLYTQEFDTGAETFEFSCYLDENVVEGNYVAFYYNNQYKLFTIMDMEQTHKKGRLVANCYCEIASLSLLNNYVREFSGDMNCIQFFEHILNGTDWHIGKYSTSLRNRVETIKVSKIENVWSLIEDYKDIFECEINVRVTYENGHVTGQYIDIYSDGGLGSSTLKRFEYGRNVTGITKKKELYDWCTGIILDVDCDVSDTVIEESDGYGFTKGAGDIILNDNANRMYNAGRNYVIGVYEGKETEPVEACINAWKELEKRSTPRFDYEVTTALTEDEYEEVHLGDTVYVVDRSYTPPLFLEARVGKLELSFTDRTQNKCVLTNYKEIKSKLLDADYIKLTGTITDIVNAFFPITSEGIADGAITEGKIETTYFQQITSDIISAGIGAFEDLYVQNMTVINADIEKLNAEKATIVDLEAVRADIEKLIAKDAEIDNALINKADISQLNATNAEVQNLHAVKANIDDLNAIHADVDLLEADVAEIDTLINGHLTSDNIQSLVLSADKVTVEDAFIKDAMIDTINAGKITTGTIDTSKVNISSSDGSMTLNGSLQQFKDKNGKVRIQIGKDAQGNFTFALFSQDGQGVLIDETGIKEGAIGDGLIVDDMVADNANIAGSKLDINSVVTSINNGTTNILSSKIYLDEEGQSLKVAFDKLKTKVETIEDVTIDGDLSSIIEQVTTNTTNINIMLGEISSLISNTTITKENGEVVQLKDEYSSTKQTVDSMSSKIGSLETTVDSVSSKQSSMEQNLNGFKTEVSNTYTTKQEFENLEIGTRNLLLKTSEGRTLVGDGTENQYIHIYDFVDSVNLIGKTVTISFDYILSNWNGEGGIKAQTGYSQWNQFEQVWFEEEGKFNYTSTITFSETAQDPSLLLRADWLGGTVEILPGTMILVIGDRKADWQPAIEDIESNIESSISASEDTLNSIIKNTVNNLEIELDSEFDNYVTKADYNEHTISMNSTLEQTNSNVNMTFERTTEMVQSIEGQVTTLRTNVETHIRFDENGIEIGKTDSPFSVNIDNTRMSFIEGTKEIAYISNNEMKITDANVQNSLTLGAFKFIPRSTGNVSLVWDDNGNMIPYTQAYPNAIISGDVLHKADLNAPAIPGNIYTIEICGDLGDRQEFNIWNLSNESNAKVEILQLYNTEFRNGVVRKSFLWTDSRQESGELIDLADWFECFPGYVELDGQYYDAGSCSTYLSIPIKDYKDFYITARSMYSIRIMMIFDEFENVLGYKGAYKDNNNTEVKWENQHISVDSILEEYPTAYYISLSSFGTQLSVQAIEKPMSIGGNTQLAVSTYPYEGSNVHLSYIKLYPGDEYWKDYGNLLSYNNVFTETEPYIITAEYYDDTYKHTGIYAYLEAGKTYRFTCKHDKPWWDEIESGDDACQAFMYALATYDNHIHLESDDFQFTVPFSGRWGFRADANITGQTYKYWDMKIVEVTPGASETNSVTIEEGDE